MGSEYREALLAAARVCREISETRPYVVNDFTEGIRTGAHRCANAILALAEQEDQRGAAENTRRDESTSAGSTPAQSAPHPDPAGQVSAQAEFGRSAEANLCKQRDAAGNAAPALPGPNQRDGCQRARPVKDNIYYLHGMPDMCCTKDRYMPGPETVSVPDDCERAWDALPQRLRGRGDFLLERGRIKDAELMFDAATEIDSNRAICECVAKMQASVPD